MSRIQGAVVVRRPDLLTQAAGMLAPANSLDFVQTLQSYFTIFKSSLFPGRWDRRPHSTKLQKEAHHFKYERGSNFPFSWHRHKCGHVFVMLSSERATGRATFVANRLIKISCVKSKSQLQGTCQSEQNYISQMSSMIHSTTQQPKITALLGQQDDACWT